MRDRAEAAQLMELLENEIESMFFRRDARGLPLEWLERVRRSIEAFAGAFSAHRMVSDYADLVYRPLARRSVLPLSFEGDARLDALAA